MSFRAKRFFVFINIAAPVAVIKMKLNQLFAALTITSTAQLLFAEAQTSWSDGVWTWISGSDTGHVPGVYGTKGIPSIKNYPGGRWRHSLVIDSSKNCLYVLGGNGYAQTINESTGASTLLIIP